MLSLRSWRLGGENRVFAVETVMIPLKKRSSEPRRRKGAHNHAKFLKFRILDDSFFFAFLAPLR